MKEISEKEFYRMLDQLEEEKELDEEEAENQEFDPDLNEWDEISLKGATIQNKRVSQLCFHNCKFENVTFDNCFIYNLEIKNCTFSNCYFRDIQVDTEFVEEDILMNIGDSRFNNCTFNNIKIDAFRMQSDIGRTKFYQTKWEQSYFGIDIELGGCSFEECELIDTEVIVNSLYSSLVKKTTIKNSKIQSQFMHNTIRNTKMIESILDIVHLWKY